MIAAMGGCQQWFQAKGVLKLTKDDFTISVYIKMNSLSSSYLVIEGQIGDQQSQCFIPISADIIISFDQSSLNLQFTAYDNISIAFQIDSISDLELLISHLGKSSILFNCESDSFKQENLSFLSAIKSESLSRGYVGDCGALTILSPITSSSSAKDIWASRIREQNSHFFLKSEPIRISFLTWNVAGRKPQPEVVSELSKGFQVPTSPSDIVVIAFEEIDMGLKSVVTGSSNVSTRWTDIVSTMASTQFEIIENESLGGVFCAILVRKGLKIPVTKGQITTMKLGVGGLFANKSAILAPITVGEAKIMAVAAHLAPHEQNVNERNSQLREISAQVGKGYDYTIVLGDLNYRITASYEETISLIEKGNFDELTKYDQLKNSQLSDETLASFKEAKIKFQPTYKYDLSCDIYDTSPKHRVPSWTDRVLVRVSEPRLCVGPIDKILVETDVAHHYLGSTDLFVTDCHLPIDAPAANFPGKPHCICYRSLRCNYSDHRPVNAVYEINIPVVDKDRLQEVDEIITAKFEEMLCLSIPALKVRPEKIEWKGEEEIEVSLENVSLVWAKWSVRKIAEGMDIEPDNGLLYAQQKTVIKVRPNMKKRESCSISIQTERGRRCVIPLVVKEDQSGPEKPLSPLKDGK